MRTRLIAAAAVAAGAALVLSACSSAPSPTPASSSAAPASSSAAPTPTGATPPIGGDPATWAPVEIDPMKPQTAPVVLVPNQRAVFAGMTDGKAYQVRVQDDSVVQPVQPTGTGGNATRAGLVALSPGTSVVSLTLDGAEVYNPVTIVVKEQSASPSAP